MKSTENKKELIKVLCASEQTANIQLIGEENSVYKHEEADCNIIRYVKQFIHEGKKHIQIQADDTDIFILLVYFCHIWKTKVKLQ